jgi:asparagine synthase (glutamine-hydrolysing)
MCGIAVILNEINPERLNQMMMDMQHRGPDDRGTFFSDSISLGQVRLSIIDINGGHQPIFNETGDKCIIFNGEIYNFKEIRKRLEKSHNFTTNTDTEAILHLYEELGTKCLKEISGMFAFAIYDNGQIFIARDRIGIKPLYYGKTNDTNLIFASELKCLYSCQNITEFPPGYYYTSSEGFKKYYEIPFSNQADYNMDEIKNKMDELLNSAVKRRLISDVPVGVFLSGGLDSSIITAIMRKHQDEIYSFAVGTENSEDLQAASRVAKYLGTKHFEYIYTTDQMIKDLPKIIYYLESFDAPLVRSAIPNYYVAKLAQKHGVKVILTGEGADELFGGYHYLKHLVSADDLFKEIKNIINRLHNTNLQRTDRMSMAASVETRVPYLDIDVIEYSLTIPNELKLSDNSKMEKHLLRVSFENYLPSYITWRPKKKFSDGAGSMYLLEKISESFIDDYTYNIETQDIPFQIRSKEELYYYYIFRKFYKNLDPEKVIGRTYEYEKAL